MPHPMEDMPFTVVVDPGQKWCAICAFRGPHYLNGGILTPHTNGPLFADVASRQGRLAAIFDPAPCLAHCGGGPVEWEHCAFCKCDPEHCPPECPEHCATAARPVTINTPGAAHLITPMCVRLLAAFDQLVEWYAHPDEEMYAVVEAVRGRKSNAQLVAQNIGYGCTTAMQAGQVWTDKSTRVGSRHAKARGGNGNPLDYYHPRAVSSRPELGAPNLQGDDVPMIPNEHHLIRDGEVVHVKRGDDPRACDDLYQLFHCERFVVGPKSPRSALLDASGVAA